MRDFIIQRPDGQIREDHELPDFVMVREGEKGMYELDDATRHNEGYAQNYNDSQSHNAATLQAAFIASFTGNWGKVPPANQIDWITDRLGKEPKLSGAVPVIRGFDDFDKLLAFIRSDAGQNANLVLVTALATARNLIQDEIEVRYADLDSQ
jgi:hypothetical protein